MTEEEKQKARLEYFQMHALPWQMNHIKYRVLGLQIFMAAQAALLVAAKDSAQIRPIASFGLASCLAFYLWDSRNRIIIGKIHEYGHEIVDKHLFPITDHLGNLIHDDAGELKFPGIYKTFGDTLKGSGNMFSGLVGSVKALLASKSTKDIKEWLYGFKSHTRAIVTMNLATACLWGYLLVSRPFTFDLVTETCPNRASEVWTPLQTNTVTKGSCYPIGPQGTNYSGQIYRVRLQ